MGGVPALPAARPAFPVCASPGGVGRPACVLVRVEDSFRSASHSDSLRLQHKVINVINAEMFLSQPLGKGLRYRKLFLRVPWECGRSSWAAVAGDPGGGWPSGTWSRWAAVKVGQPWATAGPEVVSGARPRRGWKHSPGLRTFRCTTFSFPLSSFCSELVEMIYQF